MVYYVYILASKKHGTLYIGVTNNLPRRIWEHKQGVGSDFTKKYSVHHLVHIETFDDVKLAIQREKTLKEWKRDWKIALIEKDTTDWNDLYGSLNA
jgi:putative endonuclease